MTHTALIKKTAIIISLILALAFTSVTVVMASQASAQEVKDNICTGADLTFTEDTEGPDRCKDANNDGKVDEKSAGDNINGLITDIVNILSTLVGIVAVIMIIWSGFRYITSGGDSGRVSSAKNTIIYAIVGLIIAALAQVIVRFVLNKV